MTRKLEFATNIDLKGNEIQNVVIETMSDAPSGTGVVGRVVSYGGTLYVGTGQGWSKLGQATAEGELASKVSTLETKMTTAEAAIETNADAIETNRQKTVANEGAITALTTRVSTAEGKITTLEGEMDTAQADIKALEDLLGTTDGSGSTTVVSRVETLEGTITSKANAADVYTKTEANNLLAAKADASTTYTKTEVDTTVTNINNSIASKANAADVYTKTQVDNKLSSVYRYKDSVAALPTAGESAGDVYNISEPFTLDDKNYPAGTNVAWNGSAWDALAGIDDLSAYYTSDEVDSKVTELTNSINTKLDSGTFTSYQGEVTNALALKADKTYVDEELGKKADKETYDNFVSSTTTALGTKATAATGLTAGAYAKPYVNAQGIVTGSEALVETDLPMISIAKITDFGQEVRKATQIVKTSSAGAEVSCDYSELADVAWPHVSVYRTSTGAQIYAEVIVNVSGKTVTVAGNEDLGAITIVISA